MANKRVNIPKKLLIELLEKNWGNVYRTKVDLAKNGFHCSRGTLLRYIENYELEEFIDELRDDFAEDKCFELLQNVNNSPDPDKQRVLILNMRGHKIGWRPNEVKHQQDLEKIEAQKNADKDLLREQMRKEIMDMTDD